MLQELSGLRLLQCHLVSVDLLLWVEIPTHWLGLLKAWQPGLQRGQEAETADVPLRLRRPDPSTEQPLQWLASACAA